VHPCSRHGPSFCSILHTRWILLVYYPSDLSDALGATLAEEEGAAEHHVLAVVLQAGTGKGRFATGVVFVRNTAHERPHGWEVVEPTNTRQKHNDWRIDDAIRTTHTLQSTQQKMSKPSKVWDTIYPNDSNPGRLLRPENTHQNTEESTPKGTRPDALSFTHHEPEPNRRRLSCSQGLHPRLRAGHGQYRRRLPDHPAVDHRLVPRRDGGGVVKDDHVRLELARRLGVVLAVDGHHPLAEGGPPQRHPAVHRADGERRALSLAHLLDALPLALDAADLVGLVGAIRIAWNEAEPRYVAINIHASNDSQPRQREHYMHTQIALRCSGRGRA